jgi:hypothetical protein
MRRKDLQEKSSLVPLTFPMYTVSILTFLTPSSKGQLQQMSVKYFIKFEDSMPPKGIFLKLLEDSLLSFSETFLLGKRKQSIFLKIAINFYK